MVFNHLFNSMKNCKVIRCNTNTFLSSLFAPVSTKTNMQMSVICYTAGQSCCRHSLLLSEGSQQTQQWQYATGAVQPVVTNPVDLLLSAQLCQVSSKVAPLLVLSCRLFCFHPFNPTTFVLTESHNVPSTCYKYKKKTKQKKSNRCHCCGGWQRITWTRNDLHEWKYDFLNEVWVNVLVLFWYDVPFFSL